MADRNPLDDAEVAEQKLNFITVGEGIQIELKRNRELLQAYRDIGPAGAFGYAMINADIDAAEKALAEGNVIDILQCYTKLKGNE